MSRYGGTTVGVDAANMSRECGREAGNWENKKDADGG